MDLNGFTIDLPFWLTFFERPIAEQAMLLFALGAWVPLAAFFIKALGELWVLYRQTVKNVSHWEWVILAVDIPPMFIQSPKAVEQIFAQLSGTLQHIDVGGKFWQGKKQKWFSLEVISIEGYIQFLVRTEAEYRDLVEAAIYAQYTDAQITEVEDYVDNIPSSYPNEEYDVMGVEFKLSQPDPYPIRTYPSFQYNLSKDAVFSDPMAAILENFTRIGRGENLWLEIIVEPVDNNWKNKGITLAKSLMKGEDDHGPGGGLLTQAGSVPGLMLKEFFNILHWNFEEEHHDDKKDKKVDITPGTRSTVEAIEEKISKIGFKSKVRILYAAKKNVYSPNHCIEGIIGAMNQFHIMNRNAIVPYMATHAHYDSSHVKSNRLKNSFVQAFKKRKMKWKFQDGYILNIEELATVWHFPLPFVKTPLLQKAGHKKSEPPAGLPIETSEPHLRKKGEGEKGAADEDEPPENLPFG